MLFTTPGFEKYTSGVSLFEETLFQKALDGTPFPKLLAAKGVLPGIQDDQAAQDLPGAPGGTTTAGIDSLAAQPAKYREDAARVTTCSAAHPTRKGTPRA